MHVHRIGSTRRCYSYMIVAVSLHKTHIRVVESLVKIAAVSWHSLRRFIKPAPDLYLYTTVCTLHRVLYTGAQAHCSSYSCVMCHNSPIANATIILKSGLVHTRLHLYNPSGVFYFPWHRHQGAVALTIGLIVHFQQPMKMT